MNNYDNFNNFSIKLKKEMRNDFKKKHNIKRLYAHDLIEPLRDKGYRFLGQDPYHNHDYHVAMWNENKTSSTSVGWFETLEEIIYLYL